MKQYTALNCYADRATLDLLVAAGSTLPTTGMLDNESNLVLYFDEGVFEDSMLEDLRRWLPDSSDAEFEIGSVEEQNWNAEFEQSLEPIRMTDRLVITQSWNPVEPTSATELVVTIDPKMSFGTGHHESTRLIARLMMRLEFTGKRVLDIGTGTGVLAIIAAMRGAARILAFDNNEWAVANTIENIHLNRIDGIDIRQCELSDIDENEFDIVLANLHRNIIIELFPNIVRRFNSMSDATLLTSGVLIVDYEELLETAAVYGFKPVAEERENEWVATMFQL